MLTVKQIIQAVATMDPGIHAWGEVPPNSPLVQIASTVEVESPILASAYSSEQEAINCVGILAECGVPVAFYNQYESMKQSLLYLNEKGLLEEHPQISEMVKAFESGQLNPVKFYVLANRDKFKEHTDKLKNAGVDTTIVSAKEMQIGIGALMLEQGFVKPNKNPPGLN